MLNRLNLGSLIPNIRLNERDAVNAAFLVNSAALMLYISSANDNSLANFSIAPLLLYFSTVACMAGGLICTSKKLLPQRMQNSILDTICKFRVVHNIGCLVGCSIMMSRVFQNPSFECDMFIEASEFELQTKLLESSYLLFCIELFADNAAERSKLEQYIAIAAAMLCATTLHFISLDRYENYNHGCLRKARINFEASPLLAYYIKAQNEEVESMLVSCYSTCAQYGMLYIIMDIAKVFNSLMDRNTRDAPRDREF